MLQPESRSNLLRVEIPAPEWDPLLREVKWFVFMAEGADERQREVTAGIVQKIPLVRVQVLNHGATLSRLCPCGEKETSAVLLLASVPLCVCVCVLQDVTWLL